MKITLKTKFPSALRVVVLIYDSEEKALLKEQSSILRAYHIQEEDLVSVKKNPRVFRDLSMEKGRTLVLIDLKEKRSFKEVSELICQTSIQQKDYFPARVGVDLRLLPDFNSVEAIVNGFELSTYQLSLYKQDQTPHPLASDKAELILCVPSENKELKEKVAEAKVAATIQKQVMDLVNAPGNKANAPYMVKWTQKAARDCGFKVDILSKAQIEKKGLKALLAVNRGSEWDPAFIIAEYRGGKASNSRVIGLVGKGVTFDTGGLSIKGHNNMHYMKSDMGGAAAVLGTIAAVARLQWPVDVIAIAPITDNCVDADAIKPGDVIDSYSGKTIEVINTDAEGRLILADALSYLVKNYEADHIVDLATLTGSSIRTFGTACAAMFSNDDELADNLRDSGMETGEKVWELPLWEEYGKEMQSDIADIKNLSTRPLAGAITAAKFLEAFIEDHPSWAHMDIAGMAFGDTPFGKDKAATGYGVQLLLHFIREHML